VRQFFHGLRKREVPGDRFESSLELREPQPGSLSLMKKEGLSSRSLDFSKMTERDRSPSRQDSVGNLDRLAELIDDLVPCDLPLVVVKDPAHHSRVDGEVQRRHGASHQAQAIKLFDPCVASLFLGADDGDEVLAVIIEHGDIGPEEGRIDDIQPFDDTAIRIDAAAKVLIGTVRGALQFHFLDPGEPVLKVRGELGEREPGGGREGLHEGVEGVPQYWLSRWSFREATAVSV